MKTNVMVRNAFFTALLCILSVIALPVSEVPFSLGLVGVFMCGLILTPENAFISALCYILIGAIGVPVFAGFKGGIGILIGATGGFIFSYPLVAFCVSYFSHLTGRKNLLADIWAMIASLIICYAIGTGWFSVITGSNFFGALAVTVYPFTVFDLIKIVICLILRRFVKI
ncbi:MAG: biotin transporter BioY [Clostridia bacterium]|nr:biotin transporter BioY [Clostridia bacterium]